MNYYVAVVWIKNKKTVVYNNLCQNVDLQLFNFIIIIISDTIYFVEGMPLLMFTKGDYHERCCTSS